jgi:hypothetical protein
MRIEQLMSQNSQRLADLKRTAADLQRELMDVRVEFERERPPAKPGRRGAEAGPAELDLDYADREPVTRRADRQRGDSSRFGSDPARGGSWRHGRLDAAHPGRDELSDDQLDDTWARRLEEDLAFAELDQKSRRASDRTTVLLNRGRQPAQRRSRWGRKKLIGYGAAALAVIIILIVVLLGHQASWPATSLQVQAEVTKACQNPDVASEPGQVNFACAKATRQILWVFALITSQDNPAYSDQASGRRGLEPISPAQGGVLALSLNLHHPYDPYSPVDSIQVAARAINDIIGGATVIRSSGKTMVQNGLEGTPAKCARYTGSRQVRSAPNFPVVCAHPVTSQAGQAALVADVFSRWYVGAPASQVHDAAVLFKNATNPGSAAVQTILKRWHAQ